MPWEELKPMDLKVMFIAAYLAERDTFSQLCRDYQVSRKTGYKWVELYEAAFPCGSWLACDDGVSANIFID